MSSEPQKLHPAAIGVLALGALRDAALPIIVLLFTAVAGNGLDAGALEVVVGDGVKGDELLRPRRRKLQMLLRQALDALGPVEQAPFGAKHRDGIALGLDVLAQAPDVFIESACLVFSLIDDVGERNEREHQADIDETQHGLTRHPQKIAR